MTLEIQSEQFDPKERVEFWKRYFGELDYDRKNPAWEPLNSIMYNGICNIWENYVAKDWYGFDISGVPLHWFMVVYDTLHYFYKHNIKFDIQQIKLKFGGIRMYLAFQEQTDDTDRCEEILRQVEDLLRGHKPTE
jgi:hypothetical protein